jgi:hypothetical protein
MVVQGTQKLVVTICINFKDHVLIKRQLTYEKMNVTGMMFNYEKKWGNHQQQFVFVTRSCACL